MHLKKKGFTAGTVGQSCIGQLGRLHKNLTTSCGQALPLPSLFHITPFGKGVIVPLSSNGYSSQLFFFQTDEATRACKNAVLFPRKYCIFEFG